MNALYDDDVPSAWLGLQENYHSRSEPSFTHLEVALAPRTVAVPAAKESSAGNRLIPQPDAQWHQLDSASFSQPAYKARRNMRDEKMRQQCFDWKVDGDPTIQPHRARAADPRSDERVSARAPGTITALIDASIRGDRQAVQMLLWQNEDANLRDHRGLTALYHAIDHNQLAVAETLSAAGAIWTRFRSNAASLLIPALKADLPNLLRYALSTGADIAVTDRDGRMPLHHAVLNMRHAFLPCLANPHTVAHADASGNTPLHLAVLACNQAALKALLIWQVALNVRNQEGNTPLCCACALPSVNSVMLLMRAGADIALENRLGQRPLHIACLHGQTDSVRMLLALGADPHVRTVQGETALDIAQRVNMPDIVSALMLGGATD